MSLLSSQKKKVYPSKICVQIETGQKIWYELHRDKPVSQIYSSKDDADEESLESRAERASGHYISVTKEDFRVTFKKPVNAKDAKSAVIRASDSTDELSIINESKAGAAYGTSLGRLRDESGEIISVFPLFQISDLILKSSDHPAGEKGLVVYQLANADGHDLLVFVNISDLGVMTYKAAIFEEDSEKAITLHKNASGFDETVKTYAVDKDLLYAALDSLPVTAYPVVVSLMSMHNINIITPYIAAVCVAGVVGVGAWSFSIASELSSVRQQQTESQEKITGINTQIDGILTKNPAGYAKLTSVDFEKVFTESEMLYLPTSTMMVKAQPLLRTYEMTLPIKSGNVWTLSSINDKDVITEAMTRKVTAPCAVGSIIFTGDLNEIKASYSCPSSNSDLRALGL